jgi:hypothetical protein
MLRMRRYLLGASIIAVSLVNFMAASPAMAQTCTATTPAEAIACGANNSAGAPTSATPVKDLNTTITNIINILSVIVGIVAVIMLVVGGFRYITSGGSAEAIKSAKNTIIYAIIGLVVVALAQLIVQFVLEKATSTPDTTATSSSTCGKAIC